MIAKQIYLDFNDVGGSRAGALGIGASCVSKSRPLIGSVVVVRARHEPTRVGCFDAG